jgi:hypothetical protein
MKLWISVRTFQQPNINRFVESSWQVHRTHINTARWVVAPSVDVAPSVHVTDRQKPPTPHNSKSISVSSSFHFSFVHSLQLPPFGLPSGLRSHRQNGTPEIDYVIRPLTILAIVTRNHVKRFTVHILLTPEKVLNPRIQCVIRSLYSMIAFSNKTVRTSPDRLTATPNAQVSKTACGVMSRSDGCGQCRR